MTKTKKQISTFEQEMLDVSFKKEFDKAYQEFALSELLLALMQEGKTSVRKLAKAAGLSATSIQKMRSGDQKDIKVSNLLRIASEFGYSIVLEKGNQRIPLGTQPVL
jgi:DNA-binding Xre family transcriptional regulator